MGEEQRQGLVWVKNNISKQLSEEKEKVTVQTSFGNILIYDIYPTRCNVTQFISSGNCYTCFGW